MTDPHEPALALRFSVELGSIPFGNITACEGLDAQYQVYEFSEGGNNDHTHRLPAGVSYSNVRISRQVDAQSRLLAAWFSQVRTSLVRTTATVIALDGNSRPVADWILQGVWPVRYSGPKFSATASTAAIETIELAHNGFIGGPA